ncbi:hypothetical protein Tco_0212426 [Tanacetum coccineum]
MATLEFYDKHNMVAYLVKSEGSEGFHEIIDFLTSSHIYYALTECPTLYISLIKQFWQTAALSTTEDGVHAITATIDGRDKIITEASIRRHLKLQDSEGLTSLPNAEIFEQLARIGSKKTDWDQFTSTIATVIICLATNRIFNFSRFIFDAMVKNLDSTHKFLMYPRVVAVEEELKQTKKTYNNALRKLVLKVKKLEKQVRSGKARRRARIVLSEDEDEDIETREKNSVDTEVLLEETTPTELIKDLGSSEKGEKEISAAGAEVSTISHDVSTAAAALVYIRRSASKAKDKGKAIMQEPEPLKKLKKRVHVQMSVDEELARKVQEEEQAKEMAEQEQERINFEAALELQRQLNEREEVPTEATRSLTVDWSDPDVLRYHALQNRPYSVAEVRKNIVMYLNNQTGYKQNDKEKGTEKKSRGSRKKTLARKRAGEKKSKESSKRQKNEDAADYEQEKAELRLWLKVAQDDEEFVNPEILSTKLVQERFQDYPLEGRDLLLWGDLRMIFDPDEKDDIWMNQLD